MIVIEPFKQIRLGLYVLALSITFLIAAAYLFYLAFHEQYKHVMEIFNVVDPTIQWELVNNDVFHHNAVRLGILFVSFVAILSFVVFRMTHRIFGPLVSIERFVDQIARGQYDRRVKIRKRDDLQRLAEKLNIMAEQLEKRHGVNSGRRASDRKTDAEEES